MSCSSRMASARCQPLVGSSLQQTNDRFMVRRYKPKLGTVVKLEWWTTVRGKNKIKGESYPNKNYQLYLDTVFLKYYYYTSWCCCTHSFTDVSYMQFVSIYKTNQSKWIEQIKHSFMYSVLFRPWNTSDRKTRNDVPRFPLQLMNYLRVLKYSLYSSPVKLKSNCYWPNNPGPWIHLNSSGITSDREASVLVKSTLDYLERTKNTMLIRVSPLYGGDETECPILIKRIF